MVLRKVRIDRHGSTHGHLNILYTTEWLSDIDIIFRFIKNDFNINMFNYGFYKINPLWAITWQKIKDATLHLCVRNLGLRLSTNPYIDDSIYSEICFIERLAKRGQIYSLTILVFQTLFRYLCQLIFFRQPVGASTSLSDSINSAGSCLLHSHRKHGSKRSSR